MTNSESLFFEHAKKFIDVKGPREILRGIIFDGKGRAYATDSFQVLRVSGLHESGQARVQSLSGKSLDIKPFDIESLLNQNAPVVAVVNVDVIIEAVKLHCSILKSVKGSLISFESEEGRLFIEMDEGEVTGSSDIGQCQEDFYRKVDAAKLLTCLQVFAKDYEFLEIRAHADRKKQIQFFAGDIMTVLLPVH